MKEKTDNEQLMVRYLLGELPEAEQLRLEERFFTDAAAYEQMLALEDELMYDYLQGEMEPSQQARFERRFLASQEGRERAAFAQAMLTKIAEAPAPEPPKAARARAAGTGSWWQSLVALLMATHSLARLSFAVLALALLLGAVWLIAETARLRGENAQLQAARATQEQQVTDERARRSQLNEELERERARRAQLEQELAKQPAASPSPEPRGLLALVLTPGLVRDANDPRNDPKRIHLPPNTNLLQLQLNIRRPGQYQSYRATLETADGDEIWRQSRLRARTAASGQAVVLTLPANLFTPGDYVLTLSGLIVSGEAQEIGDYYFTILNR
jgi:hypothetical protein